MKKNIFIVATFGIIVTVFVLSVNAMEGRVNMAEKLSLTIKLDKEKYKIGDNFNVIYTLQNISAKPIRILPWQFEYAINKLTIYDIRKQTNVEKLRLLIYEMKFIPKKEDFILLLPGKLYAKTFNGVVKKESLTRLSQNSDVKGLEMEGLFINFKNSAFLLDDNNAEYMIKATYESDTAAIEKGRKLYGFADTWEGKIESNEVSFVVTR